MGNSNSLRKSLCARYKPMAIFETTLMIFNLVDTSLELRKKAHRNAPKWGSHPHIIFKLNFKETNSRVQHDPFFHFQPCVCFLFLLCFCFVIFVCCCCCCFAFSFFFSAVFCFFPVASSRCQLPATLVERHGRHMRRHRRSARSGAEDQGQARRGERLVLCGFLLRWSGKEFLLCLFLSAAAGPLFRIL